MIYVEYTTEQLLLMCLDFGRSYVSFSGTTPLLYWRNKKVIVAANTNETSRSVAA